ncbi:MAG: hypothetical protein HY815_20315 [Candidatus Riflebacteria bacterium]|nr:hypothetical protein [Candidatus Riflebacteria bacterium]
METENKPAQEPVQGPIGLFLCRCGALMSQWIDTAALARSLGPDDRLAWVREIRYACLGADLESIVEAASRGPVWVAACSTDLHGKTFARALAAAGLPEDRVRLVDVRGLGFSLGVRTLATGEAIEELCGMLEEVTPAPSPARPRRVAVVGRSPAALEAARLLSGAGVETVTLPEGPGRMATAVEPVEGRLRLSFEGGDSTEVGLLILGFPCPDRALGRSDEFLAGPRVIDLAEAERALQEELQPDPLTPEGVEPEAIAVVSGAFTGAARSGAPGVGLARSATLVLALRARFPASHLLLFCQDPLSGPPELPELMDAVRVEASATVVRGAVHRTVASGKRLYVHAADRDLMRRIMVAADLVILDPGDEVDPELLRWSTLLGLDGTGDLEHDGIFTRRPGVLIALGARPLTTRQALLRGAACAAYAAEWFR